MQQGTKILKVYEEKNKENKFWKKIIVKGNITTKYIEYKHKNTGTSCMSICISGLQCFHSSTKFWKTEEQVHHLNIIFIKILFVIKFLHACEQEQYFKNTWEVTR